MTAQQIVDDTWPAKMPILIGLTALIVLIGVIGSWSVLARISGAVIASGVIQVENNRQVVQHPQGGVVGEILAKDGDEVVAGQTVMRLDNTLQKSELAIIDEQLFEIRARSARLEAERDGGRKLVFPDQLSLLAQGNTSLSDMLHGQSRLFAAKLETVSRETDQIEEQIAQSKNEIDGASSQKLAFEEQLEILSEELEVNQTLFDSGLTSAPKAAALNREGARLRGQIGKLEATIAQLRGQIASLDIQKSKLVSERTEEAISALRDLRYQEIELAERKLATEEMLERLSIKSPVDGIVHGSQIFAVHAVVSPAEPIMYVVPQDQPLIVSARIDAIHIDHVHLGQEASLRFPALDQRTTPELFGWVTKISADVFTDETTGISYYQAEVQPQPTELYKLGSQSLLPGMPVETYLRTAERSPLNYFIKPFMDYFNKAFREN